MQTQAQISLARVHCNQWESSNLVV